MKIFRFKNGVFQLDGKAKIAGVLNITPDSFSDGGKYCDESRAMAHAMQMIEDGADIIDVGAMSTRPGSEVISSQQETARLGNIISSLAETGKCIISVDTIYPETAEFALENGAHIINDVSGVFNRSMAEIIKKYSAGWIITHTGGLPSGEAADYKGGVTESVNGFFEYFLNECEKFGISREYICLDPGFGFAKNTDDNVTLLKNLEKLVRDDVAFMTALSRKRFIGELTGRENVQDRLIGTIAADIIALMKGSDFIRVHDVAPAKESVNVYNSIK